MITSFLSSLSVLGFFQPMIDYVIPMSEKYQATLLEKICLEEGVLFNLGHRHQLSSSIFENLQKKLEEQGIVFDGHPGGSVLNSVKHLAKTGLQVSIGTFQGTDKNFSKLDRGYQRLFQEHYLDSTYLAPSKWLCFYDIEKNSRTEFLVIEAGQEFSSNFMSILPSFKKYDLVVVEGFLLPFNTSNQLIKKAWEDGVSVALSCNNSNFVKQFSKEHLSVLPMVSFLSMNLTEALFLTGEKDISLAAKYLLKQMMPGGVVLITNQENDFCLANENDCCLFSPLKVSNDRIGNTISFGDAAFSGLLIGKKFLSLQSKETADLISNLGAACLMSKTCSIPKTTIRRLINFYSRQGFLSVIS